MMLRSAHHAGVTPSVSLTWRNSISIVLVVVQWHDPAAHHRAAKRMLPVAVFPDRGHLLQVGQHGLDHPRPDIVPDPPGRDINHPDGGLDELELGQYPELVGKDRAADDRVKKRRMGRSMAFS